MPEASPTKDRVAFQVQFQGLAYPLGVFAALRVQNLLLFAASQVLASVADGRLLDAEIIAARAAYTHSLMAALVFGNSCSGFLDSCQISDLFTARVL